MLPAKRRIFNVIACALLIVVGTSHAAWASTSLYGRGNYGRCSYQACAAPPTVVTMQNGLKVAINLHNGQVIPLSGYKIVMTPLNGQGRSFKQADISLDGTLAHIAVPTETGTASWFWVPAAAGNATLRFDIIAVNGAHSLQQFTVTVRAENSVAAPAAALPRSLLQRAAHAVGQAIRSIPTPVVRSFPYVLFLLLGCDALLLLWQTRRELREYHTMQALLARARMLDEAKKSFGDLAAHYLRTPLTAIVAGIELLQSDRLVTSQLVDLQAVSRQMHQKVEALVSQTQVVEQNTAIAADINLPARPWRKLGLYVPVVLIGGLWAVFEYLVARAGAFSVSQVELAVQGIVFVLLATVLYQALRYRQLRRRDILQLNQVLAGETAVAQSRDQLIEDAVAALDDNLRQLDQLTAALQASLAVRSIQNGQQRFHEVLNKFAIVGRLRGLRSTKPAGMHQVSELLAEPLNLRQARLAEHGVVCKLDADAEIAIQEPNLLSFVLATLLDNAIDYSQAGGTITVRAEASAGAADITVADQGSGIPAEKIPLLFQPFSKLEDAEVFSHEGMGFSLYLDKLVMTYLGGTIALESDPGKGTVVSLWLPVLAPTQGADSSINSLPPAGQFRYNANN